MWDTTDMNITVAELGRQFERARISWPFIEAFEQSYLLPEYLLFAVGSRETNLTDEIGDGGHGRGVWQLDDRSHQIPDPFPVVLQAELAAQMLRGLLDHFSGHREPAIAAYNAGVGGVEHAINRGLPADSATTGGDYAADVLARMDFLQRAYSPLPTPKPQHSQEDDMAPVVDTKAQPINGLVPNWEADAEGNTYAWNGARPLPTLNSLTAVHPRIVAVGPDPSGDGIVLYGDDKRQENGQWVRSTYVILAR